MKYNTYSDSAKSQCGRRDETFPIGFVYRKLNCRSMTKFEKFQYWIKKVWKKIF